MFGWLKKGRKGDGLPSDEGDLVSEVINSFLNSPEVRRVMEGPKVGKDGWSVKIKESRGKNGLLKTAVVEWFDGNGGKQATLKEEYGKDGLLRKRVYEDLQGKIHVVRRKRPLI